MARVLTEFQGFSRDLLDLVTVRIVRNVGCPASHESTVVSAITHNRQIDRGNPGLDAIAGDSKGIGVDRLGQKMLAYNPKHAADATALRILVQIRNAALHDDRIAADQLAQAGVRPTLRLAVVSLAALNRHARAMDHVMWDYLASLLPNLPPWEV